MSIFAAIVESKKIHLKMCNFVVFDLHASNLYFRFDARNRQSYVSRMHLFTLLTPTYNHIQVSTLLLMLPRCLFSLHVPPLRAEDLVINCFGRIAPRN